jgi:hypothetical protein
MAKNFTHLLAQMAPAAQDRALAWAAREANAYGAGMFAEAERLMAILDAEPERWRTECLGIINGRPAIVPRRCVCGHLQTVHAAHCLTCGCPEYAP